MFYFYYVYIKCIFKSYSKCKEMLEKIDNIIYAEEVGMKFLLSFRVEIYWYFKDYEKVGKCLDIILGF